MNAGMEPTTVRAGEPGELFSLIPYLLGFHPQESIVVLAISGTSLIMTARLDLEAAAMFQAPRVGQLARGAEADHLVVVAYGADPDRTADVLDLFGSLVGDIPIEELWRVHDSHHWCLIPGCDCAQGTPHDIESTAAAAAAVAAGLRVRGSREELFAAVRLPDDVRAEELKASYEVALNWLVDVDPEAARDHLALFIERWLDDPRPLTDDECALLAVAVSQPDVRDIATLRIRHTDADHHADLWSQVARCALPPFESGPICLTGLAAWVAGDGAMLNVCIEVAERLDPHFPLLNILCQISDAGVPPGQWEVFRDHLIAVA